MRCCWWTKGLDWGDPARLDGPRHWRSHKSDSSIRIWNWFPTCSLYSWWTKTPKGGHGNRVQGWTRPWAPKGWYDRQLCGMYLVSRHEDFTPPYRSNILHTTQTIDLELASLWTGIPGLRASSWSACRARGIVSWFACPTFDRLPLDCWKINPVTLYHTEDSFLYLTWTGWWTVKLQGDNSSVEIPTIVLERCPLSFMPTTASCFGI